MGSALPHLKHGGIITDDIVKHADRWIGLTGLRSCMHRITRFVKNVTYDSTTSAPTISSHVSCRAMCHLRLHAGSQTTALQSALEAEKESHEMDRYP